MQLRYKILFFLTHKLDLKLFKKIESKLVKKFNSWFEVEHSPSFDVRIRCLVFDRNKSSSGFLKKTRIIFYIFSIRALTRTLIFTTQAIPKSNEIYELSRVKLAKQLLKNHKLVFANLVAHLSFDYLNFEEYSSRRLLSPMHFGNKFLSERLINHHTYTIENIKRRKFFLKFKSIDNGSNPILDEFISWDLSIFIKFYKSNNLEAVAKLYLQNNYPLLFNEINKYVEIDYINHELSDFTFDDVYKARGLNSYEIILDGEIWHQRFIFVENKIINFDATASPTQKFVAGNWPFSAGDRKNLGVQVILKAPDVSVNLSEAIYLMGRCDENWYHFVLDTAPRLLFFEDIPPSVPILVRWDLPSTTKEFLKKLTPRKVIEVEPDETVKVSQLYVCPGRSTVFDYIPSKGVNWTEFSPLVLKLFRHKVLDSLGVRSDCQSEPRITFERKSATRNILNWKAVHKILQDFSFQTLNFDLKFYREQVKIFHDAKFVVASGGAVLANIIFMKPGAKVLVLRSWRGNKINLWKELSESVNLKYFEVKGLPSYYGFNFLPRIHSDYYISLRKLRRILSEEI